MNYDVTIYAELCLKKVPSAVSDLPK